MPCTPRLFFIENIILIIALALPSWAIASCNEPHCTLASDGAYKNLIIGKLVHVGTTKEMNEVFTWAKSHGYWQDLPAEFAPYPKFTKMVTIAVSEGEQKGKKLTVFMTREEYESAKYNIGDMVRYSPHDPNWEAPTNPQARKLFYGVTGCVATICGQNNAACLGRYKEGIFNPEGQQISLDTGQPISNGWEINPRSLLPILPANPS